MSLSAQTAPARTVTLGIPDRVLQHDFTQIRGLRELADGRLLLTDRLEPAIYVVELGAGTVTRIGREGEGPYEYRLPGTLLKLPGDSTLVTDDGNLRLMVIGPDLKVHRSFSNALQGLGFGLYPRAVDTRGRMYFQVPFWAHGPDVPPGDTVEVERIDLRTGAIDTLGRVKGVTMPPGQVRYGLPYVPFSPEDGWQATADGRVVFVRSADYHIEWRGPDGKVARGAPIPFTTLPVTQEDKITYTRTFMENSSMSGRAGKNGGSTGMGAVPSEMLTPKSIAEIARKNLFATKKPPFTDAAPKLGPDGTLWVERSTPAGAPRTFDVFDATGRVVQSVVLPANHRLLAVGVGGIYLVATMDDGIERLERYARP